MKNLEINFQVTTYNIKIINSYLITDIETMSNILDEILQLHPEYQTKRTKKSLIREWKAHNFFYNLHILRSHTQDCDFEVSQKIFYKILYFIFGGIK